jgi:hypothetical protein
LGATPAVPTDTATAATAEPPTAAPPETPRPTRRPRPTPTASPTEPPDVDVTTTAVVIHAHTDDPVAGFHVDVNIGIDNKGTDKARRFTVAVTCLGYTQTQDVFGGIDGGEQYIISFGFYASIADEGKTNRIVLDTTDRVAETNEDNNVYELTSAPEEYPDSCDREAAEPPSP